MNDWVLLIYVWHMYCDAIWFKHNNMKHVSTNETNSDYCVR